MSNLKLTLACGNYDRTEALKSGEVKIEGVDLTYLGIQHPMKIFGRMLSEGAFDIAEMGLMQAVALRGRGAFPFAAIPVFPSRYFRHGTIFINRKAGIDSPADLRGRKIGVQGYQMTAAVWQRGILHDEYGVSFDGVTWVEGGVNELVVPGAIQTSLMPYEKLSITHIDEGRTLGEALADGEIDALIGAIIPNSFGDNPDVVRLFPDSREEEKRYYARTGIFPIMHTVVIRQELCDQHPWLPEKVYNAFENAKEWAKETMRFSGSLRFMLPWLFDHLAEIDENFDGDPWCYGLEENRSVLETYARYAFEQNFIRKPITLDEIFVS